MKRGRTLALCLALGSVLGTPGVPALALEAGEPPAAIAAEAATPPEARPAEAVPAMDPAVRALLIGVAASLLREAAASPDPMSGLGSSLERTFTSLLQSPEALQLVAGLVVHAVKDAPPELREPLALFAMSMVNSLRREMLRDSGPGPLR